MFSSLATKDTNSDYSVPRPRRGRFLMYQFSGTGSEPVPRSPSSWVNGLVVLNNLWDDKVSFLHQMQSLMETYKSHFKQPALVECFDYFKLDRVNFELSVNGLANALLFRMCEQFTHPEWTYEKVDMKIK
jgi:hypothetical protein